MCRRAAVAWLLAAALLAIGGLFGPPSDQDFGRASGRAAYGATAEEDSRPAGTESAQGEKETGPVEPSGPQVDVLTWEGAINPVTAEVVRGAIERAEREKREVLVIRLDTPGGLDSSMRDIIKRMLVSEVPIVVFVAPSGGRAASAGTFITLAAHVAAMSPGTSIGAATPVGVGGGDVAKDMAQKVKNDAVSYIRSLASQRGRNADWAEEAVREGSSLDETEALEENVIDLVARDVEELLQAIHGRKVEVAGITRTLDTKDAVRHEVAPNWRQKLLARIIDPNIAYILFILGFYGLLFELSNPGSILPGVVGGICLLLAFFAFQALPINLTGLFLIIFAMILFAVDVKVQSHGILTLGGIVALFLGSLLLLSGESGTARISLSVIATVVAATVAFFVFVVGAVYRAQRRKVSTGEEGLVGEVGTALSDLSPAGQVYVHGEYWSAEADEPLPSGTPIVVERVEGMRLRVRRATRG